MRRRLIVILLVAILAGVASAYAAFRLVKAPHAAASANDRNDDTLLF